LGLKKRGKKKEKGEKRRKKGGKEGDWEEHDRRIG